MGEYKEHIPRVINLDDQKLETWLKDSRSIVNHELLSAIEVYVYDERTEPVSAMVLNISDNKYGDIIIHLAVKGDELLQSIESIEEWALKVEEYEFCQRIKNLKDYINENELEFSSTE